MSLLAEVKTGCASSDSSFGFGFAGGDERLAGFVAETADAFPALPLIQVTFCAMGVFDSVLQRIKPTMTATCAPPMSVTFRQKGRFICAPRWWRCPLS